MAFTHIDCFSGPGGICTGMHAAGFDTKVAIEFIESCVETYRANHPEVQADLCKDPTTIAKAWPRKHRNDS